MAEIGKYECAWHKWNHVTAKKVSETYNGYNFEGYSLFLKAFCYENWYYEHTKTETPKLLCRIIITMFHKGVYQYRGVPYQKI